MQDLSVLFLTLNRMPQHFAEYQFETLKKAVGDARLLAVSRQPMDCEYILDDNEPGYINIYRQMLRGAKLLDTEYIAVAEDDCLYHKSHYKLRPSAIDTFLYNQHRWGLFTWDAQMYSWRNRYSNSTLIAPRKLLIEALEERFEKLGDNWNPKFIGEVGRDRVERGLGVTRRKSEIAFSPISVVQFNHVDAHEERQKRRRKSFGNIRATDIPHWGKSVELNKIYEN